MARGILRRAALGVGGALVAFGLGFSAAAQSTVSGALGSGQSVQAILEAGAREPAPPSAVLQSALDLDIGGVVDYLTAGNASPQKMGARAVALVGSLEGLARADVITAGQLNAAIDFVRQVTSEAVCAPRVLTAIIDPRYTPPRGVPNYDFGGWETSVGRGWYQYTVSAAELQGLYMSAFDGIGQGAVFADAVNNVESFSYALPNGRYRVILLTPRTELADFRSAQFGQRMVVNGVPFAMGNTPPETWVDGAQISNRQLSGGGGQGDSPAGSGGMIVVDVEVFNGLLEMQFQQAPPKYGALLSGVIIEDAGQPSVVSLQGEAQTALDTLAPSCVDYGLQVAAALREAGKLAEQSAAGNPFGPPCPFCRDHDPEGGPFDPAGPFPPPASP